MKAQAAALLLQAEACLRRAETMIKAGLPEDAARTAYIACFHVAQALIFEANGKTPKTHHGVQVEFFRLTKDDRRADPELRRFLSQAYEYKAVADYYVGDAAVMDAEEADATLDTAKRFKAHFAELLT